jgi:hypothetical protein
LLQKVALKCHEVSTNCSFITQWPQVDKRGQMWLNEMNMVHDMGLLSSVVNDSFVLLNAEMKYS